MTEPYHIQKERIRQGLKDAHRPYNFYCSDIYKSLFNELEEAYKANEVELFVDIMADIETARKNFKAKLPWWYRARWKACPVEDPRRWLEAKREYEKNIYKRETVIYVNF